MKKYYLLTLIFAFNTYFLLAQTEQAPTLTLGLNELVGFKKGVIDVELLSEIIANKQDEIKKEIIKRELLEPIAEHGNFMYYNYAYNVSSLLLKEKNKKVITKEILEYTSNFALVYGFTELYLQLAVKSQNKEFENFINTITGNTTLYDTLQNEFSSKGKPNILVLNRLQKYTVKLSNCFKNSDKDNIMLNDVLVDMVFDICKNNDEIKQKGFFVQALNMSEQEYEEKNMYRKVINCLKKDTTYKNNIYEIATLESQIKEINENSKKLQSIIVNLSNEYVQIQDYLNTLYKIEKTEFIKEIKKEIKEVQGSNRGMENYILLLQLQKLDNLINTWNDNNGEWANIKNLSAKLDAQKCVKIIDCLSSLEYLKNRYEKLSNSDLKAQLDLDDISNKIKKQISINKDPTTLKKYYDFLSKKIKDIDSINNKITVDTALEKIKKFEVKQVKDLRDKIKEKAKKDIIFMINSLKSKINKSLTTFFDYYEVLKETNFLQGNNLSVIDSLYKTYLSEAPQKAEAVLGEVKKQKNEFEQKNSNLIIELNSKKGKINNLLKEADSLKKELDKLKDFLIDSLKYTTSILNTELKNLTTNINPDKFTELLRASLKFTEALQQINNDSIKNVIRNKFSKIYSLELLVSNYKSSQEEINLLEKQIKNFSQNLDSLEKIEVKTNQEYESVSNLTSYFHLNIQLIENYLLYQQSDLSVEGKQTVQDVYKAITILKNPNGKYNTLSFANYLLDSLNFKLVKIVAKDKNIASMIKNFEMIALIIKVNVLSDFKPKFEYIKEISTVNPKKFIEFITQLNELNKSKTYDYLFKTLIDAGNI
ncbi:MAG: hypothetical protein MUE81_13685, partial [Thermoflexibacter sp.]|nr:hypothetical protein [Thermoflexibacter sp.]